nr:hypothetical protein CFP56_71160 [Quercus suber]
MPIRRGNKAFDRAFTLFKSRRPHPPQTATRQSSRVLVFHEFQFLALSLQFLQLVIGYRIGRRMQRCD